MEQKIIMKENEFQELRSLASEARYRWLGAKENLDLARTRFLTSAIAEGKVIGRAMAEQRYNTASREQRERHDAQASLELAEENYASAKAEFSEALSRAMCAKDELDELRRNEEIEF